MYLRMFFRYLPWDQIFNISKNVMSPHIVSFSKTKGRCQKKNRPYSNSRVVRSETKNFRKKVRKNFQKKSEVSFFWNIEVEQWRLCSLLKKYQFNPRKISRRQNLKPKSRESKPINFQAYHFKLIILKLSTEARKD